jgi:microcin C transport system substrate-binding protein
LRRKDGETFKLEFLSISPSFDRIITPYIDNLKTLGIDAIYNRVDPAQYQQRSNSFNYDMVFDGYSVGLEEGLGLDQKFGKGGVNDVFNPAGYSNPAVDKLIEAVVDAKTHEDMAAGVRAIDRIMRADYYIVPVWYLGKYWVAYYDQFEHPEELPPYALGNLDFWWFDQAKHDKLVAEGALRE